MKEEEGMSKIFKEEELEGKVRYGIGKEERKG